MLRIWDKYFIFVRWCSWDLNWQRECCNLFSTGQSTFSKYEITKYQLHRKFDWRYLSVLTQSSASRTIVRHPSQSHGGRESSFRWSKLFSTVHLLSPNPPLLPGKSYHRVKTFLHVQQSSTFRTTVRQSPVDRGSICKNSWKRRKDFSFTLTTRIKMKILNL